MVTRVVSTTVYMPQQPLSMKEDTISPRHWSRGKCYTETIPDPIPKANFKPVKVNGEPTVITFDLETTGLIEGRVLPQITQIAATELKSGSEFQTYIKPTIEIVGVAVVVNDDDEEEEEEEEEEEDDDDIDDDDGGGGSNDDDDDDDDFDYDNEI
ncbi:hypothetical protein DPMN_028807 [Dreissena polymorpha]|uniref:Uncharacterized protein n=1 Tax=Dreissena polymorpha TaxID=45954 RepID=A0A9D4LXV2_DREPO|nr:hypothetical protein DPMN_028807 [Dreissena polymorpha]